MARMSDALGNNLFNNMMFWLGDFVKFSIHNGKDNLTPLIDGRSTSMFFAITAP